MKRLIAQRVYSLPELIKQLDQRILELKNRLMDISNQLDQINKMEDGPEKQKNYNTLVKQVARVQYTYNQLKQKRQEVYEKLKNQKQKEEGRKNIGEGGFLEFYNLILSFAVPRHGVADKVFVKVYEIVEVFHGAPGAEEAKKYVVVVSPSPPNTRENYFIANKKPTQNISNAHNYSPEVFAHQVKGVLSKVLSSYSKEFNLAFDSATDFRGFPSFNKNVADEIAQDIRDVLDNFTNQISQDKVQEE